MNLTSTNVLSFILAISLHGVAIGLLFVNWEPDRIIEVTETKPYYIEATTVRQNPHRVKKEREKKQALRQREKRIKAKEEAERVAVANRRRLEVEEVKREADRKARDEAEKNELVTTVIEPQGIAESDEDRLLDQQRKVREESLNREIMIEQIGIIAVTDDEKAMAYVSQIKREIIHNWSRPPTARNGMQALLRVFLVPTGEVVNVTVEAGSGNDAFDRSAVLAVRKAERFVVPTDSRQFERNFRKFEVLFRPEDLRL
jgi:colicin import membrane protein